MKKVGELEAIRGIAALIVVVHHFAGSFTPTPFFAMLYAGSPLFAAFNGTASVYVFFVLSGFVLSLGYFKSGDTSIIVRAAGKRWFRLVFLVFIATMVSYLFMRWGFNQFKAARALFGEGELGLQTGVRPEFWDAVLQGTILSFIRQQPNDYDVALWTMFHEFYGSFLTFGLAIMLRHATFVAASAIVLGTTLIVQFVDPALTAFIAGTGLCFLYWRYRVRVPWPLALLSVVAGVYLFGYFEAAGPYRWVPMLTESLGLHYGLQLYVHTLAAILLIVGCFETPIGGVLRLPLFRYLGRISFPLYAIHLPLMFSVASGTFIVLFSRLPMVWTIVGTSLVFAVVLALASGILARADEAWLRLINRATGRMVREPVTATQ